MPRRHAEWSEGLATDLKDPAFAQHFILSSLEEGVPLRTTLGKVIALYGLKEFAKRIKMPSPNLLRAIHPNHNPTWSTLNRLLAPFGLELTATPKRRRAA